MSTSEPSSTKLRKKRAKPKKVFAKEVVLSEDGKRLVFSSVKTNKLLNGRKFRQNPELEAFYRFIHENNLRAEAYDVFFSPNGRAKKKFPQGLVPCKNATPTPLII